MKKYLSLLFLSASLAACSTQQTARRTFFENPLYAEYYYDDLVQNIVNMNVQGDPLAKDETYKESLDTARREGLKKSKEAVAKQNEGSMGSFVSVSEETVGEVLWTDSHVHIGPDFQTVPGISLHIYLSSVVDPRDVIFPDKSALDVGELLSPYESQTFEVKGVQSDKEPFHTVVLFDKALNRIHGFAQIRKTQ